MFNWFPTAYPVPVFTNVISVIATGSGVPEPDWAHTIFANAPVPDPPVKGTFV